jgi:two-component system, NarL family, sensor kinase
VSAASGVLIEHAFRGAHIQRILRLLLGLFFVAVLIFQPPDQHLALCWLVVICYALWSIAVGALIRAGGVRSLHYAWLALFVDVFTVAALTLIADSSAQRSWAPYLLINGFFLVPVIAAAQLNPWISAVVAVPAVLVYLGSSLLIRKIDADPISEIVLRTGLLAIVGIGCVLLSRVQRSRVSTIARLLDERTHLLAEMVTIEQREQRDLAETLHDGALQYVLAARQELEAVEDGDPEAAERIDLALAETSRLLRSTMTQLHPAVVDMAGLLPALRDLVETVNARGQLSAELRTRNWEDSLRTPIDELLLTTARELITNVVKHAQARTVSIELAREAGRATLRVSDDGVGMAGVDLDARLGAGHLGVASRRIRLEAAGGRITFSPADPHGTIVDVEVPLDAAHSLPRAADQAQRRDAVISTMRVDR